MNALKAITISLFIVSCASNSIQENRNTDEFVFENVNVIDVENGEVDESQTVIIRGDKIVFVGKAGDASFSKDAKKVEASGKFLMPGLAEMHAHIPVPSPGRDLTEETLFLYLSNGITTIRGMLGHPSHLELRKKVMAGEVLGPRIFTSGPSLNGNSVKSMDEANRKVRAQKNAGYDFLKLHPGLKLEVFDEIVKTAKEVGIKYAGHVSVDVGVRHAMESNYASIDHVDGFLEGLVPKKAGVDKNDNGFFGFNFSALAEKNKIEELVRLSKDNDVWVVPTQSLFERWASPADAPMLAMADEMQYMPKSVVENWEQSKNNFLNSPDYSRETWDQFIDIRRNLIYALHKRGKGLILGSDAPQVFNVPGFSIHHEIAGMLRSGLTNAEVLQIGTINPAKFFDQESEFGQVKKGMMADLILLDKNPLIRLSNLKNPAGVMVRGKWLSREFIQTELSKIAERNKNL